MFAISLDEGDRLRLINASSQVVELVRGVVRQFWPLIQREKDRFGSHEFKLKGYPWSDEGEQELPAITLLCQLFTALRRIGWKVMMHLGENVHLWPEICLK